MVGTTQLAGHARRGGLAPTGGEAGHGARDAEAALVVMCSSCIFTVFGVEYVWLLPFEGTNDRVYGVRLRYGALCVRRRRDDSTHASREHTPGQHGTTPPGKYGCKRRTGMHYRCKD